LEPVVNILYNVPVTVPIESDPVVSIVIEDDVPVKTDFPKSVEIDKAKSSVIEDDASHHSKARGMTALKVQSTLLKPRGAGHGVCAANRHRIPSSDESDTPMDESDIVNGYIKSQDKLKRTPIKVSRTLSEAHNEMPRLDEGSAIATEKWLTRRDICTFVPIDTDTKVEGVEKLSASAKQHVVKASTGGAGPSVAAGGKTRVNSEGGRNEKKRGSGVVCRDSGDIGRTDGKQANDGCGKLNYHSTEVMQEKTKETDIVGSIHRKISGTGSANISLGGTEMKENRRSTVKKINARSVSDSNMDRSENESFRAVNDTVMNVEYNINEDTIIVGRGDMTVLMYPECRAALQVDGARRANSIDGKQEVEQPRPTARPDTFTKHDHYLEVSRKEAVAAFKVDAAKTTRGRRETFSKPFPPSSLTTKPFAPHSALPVSSRYSDVEDLMDQDVSILYTDTPLLLDDSNLINPREVCLETVPLVIEGKSVLETSTDHSLQDMEMTEVLSYSDIIKLPQGVNTDFSAKSGVSSQTTCTSAVTSSETADCRKIGTMGPPVGVKEVFKKSRIPSSVDAGLKASRIPENTSAVNSTKKESSVIDPTNIEPLVITATSSDGCMLNVPENKKALKENKNVKVLVQEENKKRVATHVSKPGNIVFNAERKDNTLQQHEPTNPAARLETHSTLSKAHSKANVKVVAPADGVEKFKSVGATPYDFNGTPRAATKTDRERLLAVFDLTMNDSCVIPPAPCVPRERKPSKPAAKDRIHRPGMSKDDSFVETKKPGRPKSKSRGRHLSAQSYMQDAQFRGGCHNNDEDKELSSSPHGNLLKLLNGKRTKPRAARSKTVRYAPAAPTVTSPPRVSIPGNIESIPATGVVVLSTPSTTDIVTPPPATSSAIAPSSAETHAEDTENDETVMLNERQIKGLIAGVQDVVPESPVDIAVRRTGSLHRPNSTEPDAGGIVRRKRDTNDSGVLKSKIEVEKSKRKKQPSSSVEVEGPSELERGSRDHQGKNVIAEDAKRSPVAASVACVIKTSTTVTHEKSTDGIALPKDHKMKVVDDKVVQGVAKNIAAITQVHAAKINEGSRKRATKKLPKYDADADSRHDSSVDAVGTIDDASEHSESSARAGATVPRERKRCSDDQSGSLFEDPELASPKSKHLSPSHLVIAPHSIPVLPNISELLTQSVKGRTEEDVEEYVEPNKPVKKTTARGRPAKKSVSESADGKKRRKKPVVDEPVVSVQTDTESSCDQFVSSAAGEGEVVHENAGEVLTFRGKLSMANRDSITSSCSNDRYFKTSGSYYFVLVSQSQCR